MTNTSKTWFITGASAGFGLAFAEYALARGHNVVATARNVAKLDGLVARNPQCVLAVTLDVDRGGDAATAVDAALARFGQIDVLINNAGYGIVGAVEETPDAEWRAIMETNFFGAMAVTMAVLPVLRRQRFGAVVNISSMGGQMSMAGFGAYSATKFALEGASEALAQEMAPFGVKVLIVEPGAFRTEFAAAALRHMPVIEAYQEIVGPTRTVAHGMDKTQPGDPAKAAAAIETALASEQTPLRLPLGEDAIDAIRTHAETLLAEIKTWETLAASTRISR